MERCRALDQLLARDRIEELRLAVAGDAGDRDDFAARDLKRDIAQGNAEMARRAADSTVEASRRGRPDSGFAVGRTT